MPANRKVLVHTWTGDMVEESVQGTWTHSVEVRLGTVQKIQGMQGGSNLYFTFLKTRPSLIFSLGPSLRK